MSSNSYEKLVKEYMKKSLLKRKAGRMDYWKVSNNEINEKSPIFRGDPKVIHAPSGAGKSTCIENMLRDVKSTHKDVFAIVLLIDERASELDDWLKCSADEIVLIPNTYREIYGVKFMWDMSMKTIYRALKLVVDDHKDVILVIDSLNKLATIALAAGIVEKGNTIPGGVDENAIFKVGSYLGASGILRSGDGSITIWGTCLLQTQSDALNKGSSAILDSIAKSALVLHRDHSIDSSSYTRSAELLNEITLGKSDYIPKGRNTFRMTY